MIPYPIPLIIAAGNANPSGTLSTAKADPAPSAYCISIIATGVLMPKRHAVIAKDIKKNRCSDAIFLPITY